jgi:hypothetical protein
MSNETAVWSLSIGNGLKCVRNHEMCFCKQIVTKGIEYSSREEGAGKKGDAIPVTGREGP